MLGSFVQLAGVVGFPPHSLFVFIRTAPSLVGLQQHPKRAGPSEHHVGWCLNTKQVTWPSPEERWTGTHEDMGEMGSEAGEKFKREGTYIHLWLTHVV